MDPMKRFTIFTISFILLGLAILSLPIEDRTLAENPEDQVTVFPTEPNHARGC